MLTASIGYVAMAHDGDPALIHGCVTSRTGALRIIAPDGICTTKESPLDWNIAGIQGVPGQPGPQGDTGEKGEKGDTGVATRPAGPCFNITTRYVDCGNGTVTDTVTGLIWLKQMDCLGTADWPSANAAAAALKHGDCGLTDGSSLGDWRLPTKSEWAATMARATAQGTPAAYDGSELAAPGLGCLAASGPSLTNDAGTGCLSAGPTSFTGVGIFQTVQRFWSSSTVVINSDGLPTGSGVAFSAGLYDGWYFNNAKDNPLGVWAVRSGAP